MTNIGYRYNKGKLRWRNIPRFLLRGLVKVGEFGEKKYDTYNFLKGLSVNDTLDSLERHLDAIQDPNQSDLDPESKVNHLYHVAWNALVAAHMIETRPDLDDRYKGEKNTNIITSEILDVMNCSPYNKNDYSLVLDTSVLKVGDKSTNNIILTSEPGKNKMFNLYLCTVNKQCYIPRKGDILKFDISWRTKN